MYRCIIFFFFLLTACSNPDANLQNEILKAFKEHRGSVVAKELTAIAWDRMYIIGPYTYERNLDSILLTQLELIKSSGISYTDGLLLIMFFNNGRLRGKTIIGRNLLDMKERSTMLVPWFSPEQAIYYKKNASKKGFFITSIKGLP